MRETIFSRVEYFTSNGLNKNTWIVIVISNGLSRDNVTRISNGLSRYNVTAISNRLSRYNVWVREREPPLLKRVGQPSGIAPRNSICVCFELRTLKRNLHLYLTILYLNSKAS
ncbi:hypothetical protein AMTRI_Chr13g91080 [Amborella trichopoda]